MQLFKKSFISAIKEQLNKPIAEEADWEPIYEQCRKAIESDVNNIDVLFKNWFAVGQEFIKNPQQKGLLFYQFSKLLESRKYLPNYHSYQVNYFQIKHIPAQYGHDFQELVNALLRIDDIIITENPSFLRHGNVGDLIDFIYSIILGTISNYQDVPQYMSLLSPYVSDFIKKYPNSGHYSLSHAIQHHPNAMPETVQILANYTQQMPSQGFFYKLIGDCLNPFSKDNFFHKNAKTFFQQLFETIADFPDEHKEWLVVQLLARIGIDLRSQEVQINEHKEVLQCLIENPEKYARGIKSRQKQIAELENNFETIQQKSWQKAYKKLAVKAKTRQVFELVVKELPTLNATATVQRLLNEAIAFKKAPKTYNLNQKPTTVFKDVHFKLWVIEELMYRKELINPKMDLDALAAEYTTREINREDDGYAVIPEVKKYFKNLDIPAALLPKVEEFTIDFMSETYKHLWPFCDPGCGDELLPVSNKMIDDLALLPNLKKITGFEWLNPSKKVIKALEEKGVELIEMDY